MMRDWFKDVLDLLALIGLIVVFYFAAVLWGIP